MALKAASACSLLCWPGGETTWFGLNQTLGGGVGRGGPSGYFLPDTHHTCGNCDLHTSLPCHTVSPSWAGTPSVCGTHQVAPFVS